MKVFQNAFQLAHVVFPHGGACLEFGVHVGNSFVWQAQQVQKTHRKSSLIGFDSWEGLPEEEKGVWYPDRHAPGKYASTKDVVERRLARIGMLHDSRIRFVDGFFSDSLTPELQKEISNVIFINIDVDIYKSTIELLDFVKPLLQPGTVIYWDDWNNPVYSHEEEWGEHLAWKRWSEKNTDVEAETIEVNPLNQRYMVVTRANGKTLATEGLSMADIRRKAYVISNSDASAAGRAKKS